MSAFFQPSSYKPQVRQEGFHLPSPPPSNPSPPPSSHSANGPFDPANMFIPNHFLPDPFRSKSSADQSSASMDFSDELASLMAHSPPPPSHTHHQSNERSTHSPDLDHHHHHGQSHHPSSHSANGAANGYDTQGYRHNIFDISAPATFSSHHHSQSQQYSIPHRPDLPPLAHPSSFHNNASTDGTASYSPSSAGPPPHFNSTLPALSSSLRYSDPHTPADAYPPLSASADYRAHHTPSPSARSRSRSRGGIEPPSTHGGPARTARAKRGSISSVSPPRHPHAILIPSQQRPTTANSGGTPTLPVSPLSLHTSNGWFVPPSSQTHAHEYSLPTPDGTAYGSFGGQNQGLGVSPKDLGGGASAEPLDPATKQAMLANEKRRRRRESHNAVERRRRDNINEKISELATLIPECMLDPSASSQPPTSPTPDDIVNGNLAPPLLPPSPAANGDESKEGLASPGAGGGSVNGSAADSAVKANKGMILRKSVEYIRYLQQLVSAQASRNRELEAQLAGVHGDDKEGEMVLASDVGLGPSLARRLEGVDEGEEDDLMEVEGEDEEGEIDMEDGEGKRGRARRRGDVVVKEENGAESS